MNQSNTSQKTSGLRDWNDLNVLLTIVRSGTMRAAADTLGISHSTISRRMFLLEAELGTKLLDRRGRRLCLTEEGQAVFETATRLETQIADMLRDASSRDQKLSGRIRVTLPNEQIFEMLASDLVRFRESYPDIDLEVSTTARKIDLNSQSADLAVRIVPHGDLPDPDLIGSMATEIHFCIYATPGYLERHALHDHQKTELPPARWLGWGGDQTQPDWVLQSPFPHLTTYGSLNSPQLQLSAAKAGMGLAILACGLGDITPELTRVPGTAPYPARDVWVVHHGALKGMKRIKILREFLTRAIAEKSKLLTGKSVK
ncbi:LysR family transcriptional regulator [Roseibium sp. SCPC15]|uniref:LysR family transcriptional regulator n=1 Tax=Roseibium sp. SCP15 TaxID=3141376 RepID=UPI003335E39C